MMNAAEQCRLFFRNRKLRRRYKDLLLLVRHTLKADDDILSDARREKLRDLDTRLSAMGGKNHPAPPEEGELSRMETEFDSLLPRKSFFFTVRGYLDVLAVAASVAFGIRALYLQPFQIPTSSMQPTLFGIHYIDRKESEPYTSALTRFFRPLGASAAKVEVREDGFFHSGFRTRSIPAGEVIANFLRDGSLYLTGSVFQIGGTVYAVPGILGNHILPYLDPDALLREYHAGEDFCDGYVSSGDHLFVDRVSLHFRPLRRGDVIVFNTENISSPTQPIGGYYYIKRLAGLPGDTLKITDGVLMIRPRGERDFRPATDFSPAFRKLYSGLGGYAGHGASGLLAPDREITVPDDSLFALGDNTRHSLDGRNWGFIPRHNMIGLALNVFWPVSRRWGLVDTKAPLPVDTVIPESPYLQNPAMRLQ